MLLDVDIPDTVEAEKRGRLEAAPAGRACLDLLDDVIEDEDEVFEDALDMSEVFL